MKHMGLWSCSCSFLHWITPGIEGFSLTVNFLCDSLDHLICFPLLEEATHTQAYKIHVKNSSRWHLCLEYSLNLFWLQCIMNYIAFGVFLYLFEHVDKHTLILKAKTNIASTSNQASYSEMIFVFGTWDFGPFQNYRVSVYIKYK